MRESTRTNTNTRSEAGGSPLKVLTLTWRPWRLPLWRLNVKSSAKEFRFAMLIKTLIKNFFTTGGSLFGGCTVFDLPPQTRALFLQVSYTASNCLFKNLSIHINLLYNVSNYWLFHRELLCFHYYCRTCWESRHQNLRSHKPLMGLYYRYQNISSITLIVALTRTQRPQATH